MYPIFVLPLGVKRRTEIDDQRCLDLLEGLNRKYKYDGCADESAWYIRLTNLKKIIRYRT